MIDSTFHIIPDNCQTLWSMFSVIKTQFCKRSIRRRLTRVSPSHRNILLKNLYKFASWFHVNIQYMKIKPNSSTNVPDKDRWHLPKISGIIELNSYATPISLDVGFREQHWALALPRTRIWKNFCKIFTTYFARFKPLNMHFRHSSVCPVTFHTVLWRFGTFSTKKTSRPYLEKKQHGVLQLPGGESTELHTCAWKYLSQKNK